MYKYIFNTKGKYVAFILNDKYCFSRNNDYIGFFAGINLYNYSGEYLGTLTSDDRVIKDKNKKIPNIVPISKPNKPYLPYSPYNRYAMSRLPANFEDIFIDEIPNNNLKEFDNEYLKLLNCKIYSNDKKTFLGTINFNKYDNDSLANKYGTYGSQYSQDSIFNKYGTYGSQYSSQSPFNEYTHTPPIILDSNSRIIGKLTVNMYAGGNVINTIKFLNWFNYKLSR